MHCPYAEATRRYASPTRWRWTGRATALPPDPGRFQDLCEAVGIEYQGELANAAHCTDVRQFFEALWPGYPVHNWNCEVRADGVITFDAPSIRRYPQLQGPGVVPPPCAGQCCRLGWVWMLSWDPMLSQFELKRERQ